MLDGSEPASMGARVRQCHGPLEQANVVTRAVCRSTSGRKGNSIPYVVLILLFNLGALATAICTAYI